MSAFSTRWTTSSSSESREPVEMLPAFLILIALMSAAFVWVVREASRRQRALERMRSTPPPPLIPLRRLPQMTEVEESERWEDLRRRLEGLK
jgi:hypothetical protein